MERTLTITESDMNFGPYSMDHCFHIEKSRIYTNLNRQKEGIKIAEFLLLRHPENKKPVILIVEAKSSFPRTPESISSEDHLKRHKKSIKEILEKWINTFFLGLAICLKRHKDWENDLPGLFKLIDLSNVDFRFILVIKGHPKKELQDLQDELGKTLRSNTFFKTWGLSPVAMQVLNDEMARSQKYRLIDCQNDDAS